MVTSQVLYLIFLGFVAVERIAELVLSRAHARSAFARGAFEVGQRHYLVMAAMHSLFLIACATEVWVFARSFPGALGFVALGIALAAQALRYSAIWALGEQWNVRIIVLPVAPPVMRGPYRYVRHPNYVAVIAEFLFIPLIHGAFLTALVFSVCNGVLLTVRIRAEERALGPRYAEAFRNRPRMIPKLFDG